MTSQNDPTSSLPMATPSGSSSGSSSWRRLSAKSHPSSNNEGLPSQNSAPHDPKRRSSSSSNSGKASKGLRSRSGSADGALPELETTNWNAVKSLASKYGVQLRSYEEHRDEMLRSASAPGLSQQPTDGRLEPAGAQLDLGAGTPFRITAESTEGGRMMYRINSRDSDSTPAVAMPSTTPSAAALAVTGSSSSSDEGKRMHKKPSLLSIAAQKSIPSLRKRADGSGKKSNDSPHLPFDSESTSSPVSASSRYVGAAEAVPRPVIQSGDVLGAILGWQSELVRVQSLLPRHPQPKASEGEASHPHWNDPIPTILTQEPSSDNIEVLRDRDSNPPQLRPMQSFDSTASNQTARPGHEERNDEEGLGENEVDRDIAAMLDVARAFGATNPEDQEGFTDGVDEESETPVDSVQSSKTSVYDVFAASKTSSDPRFIIWPKTEVTSNRSARASPQVASQHSSPSRRRSSQPGRRNSSKASAESSPSQLQTAQHFTRPAPVAATATRLVAELTSEIDNRLMTDFFYTFRAFMDSHQLLELLIQRFTWAFAEFSDAEDEARRRIVRVRTYAVLKYWLTNFFELDFLGDRKLRVTLTNWLNGAGKVPELPVRSADMGIIKSLKNVVRNLKAAYSSKGIGAIMKHESGRLLSTEAISVESAFDPKRSPATSVSVSPNLDIHAITSGKASSEVLPLSSVDATASKVHHPGLSPPSPLRSPYDGSPFGSEKDLLAPGWTPLAGRQRTTTNSSSASVETAVSLPDVPVSLPTSYSAFSRALVNTVGRLSKIKRTMGGKGGPHTTFSDDEIPFDTDERDANTDGTDPSCESRNIFSQHAEQQESGRLGTTASYLGSIAGGEAGAQDATPSLYASSTRTESTPPSSIDLGRNSKPQEDANESKSRERPIGLGIDGPAWRGDEASAPEEISNPHGQAALVHQEEGTKTVHQKPSMLEVFEAAQHPSAPSSEVHHALSSQTLKGSSSPLSCRTSLARSGANPLGDRRRHSTDSVASFSRPNIVQIDDIDFSSDEDDGAVRRALRRLPGARDLRMAATGTTMQQSAPRTRSSFESISTFSREQRISPMGIARAASPKHPFEDAIEREHIPSDLFDPDDALAGYELVKGFRVEDLISDDEEEPGGIEEALRRLEGFIDDDKKAERASRVEALWEKSQARQRLEQISTVGHAEPSEDGDVSNADDSAVSDSSRDSVQSSLFQHSDAAAQSAAGIVAETVDVDGNKVGMPRSASNGSADKSFSSVLTPIPARIRKQFDRQRHAWPAGRAPAFERIRVPSNPNAPSLAQLKPPAAHPPRVLPRLAQLPNRRSLILDYKAEALARHLTLIEAELFRNVEWTELVSDRWRERRYRGQVLQWEEFYQQRVRDRAKAEATGQSLHGTAAVEAIVARFNLSCNWVASEVVLTRSMDVRVAVISKLIRIAFRCYQQLNFATLLQICLGLQTPWVERLHKTWSKVGSWEMRIFRDLKALTSPRSDFRPLRSAMRQMVVEGRLEELVTSTGPPRPSRPGGHSGTGNSISGSATKANNESMIDFNLSDRCVPFFGIFIADLAAAASLPTLLDPSDPSQPAHVDSTTGQLISLSNPAALSHLPPLPAAVEPEPLINLSKFSSVAAIVKTVLAFQAKAANYDGGAVDKELYVRCLKIECLEARQMSTMSELAEP